MSSESDLPEWLRPSVLDPAEAMLARARASADIEWVLGPAESAAWDREFDLVVMTWHAFQVLVDDVRIRASLAAIASALAEGGRFAFETRHPLARAWEGWTAANAVQAVSPSGAVITKTEQAHTPTDGRTVSFNLDLHKPGLGSSRTEPQHAAVPRPW